MDRLFAMGCNPKSSAFYRNHQCRGQLLRVNGDLSCLKSKENNPPTVKTASAKPAGPNKSLEFKERCRNYHAAHDSEMPPEENPINREPVIHFAEDDY